MNDIESASPNSESQGHRGPDTSSGFPTAPPIRTCGTARRRCRRWPRSWPPICRSSSRATGRTSRRDCKPSTPRSSPGSAPSPPSRRQYAGTPVATTEPVADYLLTAMGMKNLTPFVFQADIMNGVDPAPEDITLENGFFTKHQVKVFCYNEQVVDSLTTFDQADGASSRRAGRRRLRDDADPGLRLPVLDGRRGGGDQGRRRARDLDGASVIERPRPRGRGRRRLLLRPDHPRRRLVRDPQGGVHRADRVQRGRQDHAPAHHPRTAATGHGPRSASSGSRSPGGGRSLGYVPQKVVLDPDIPIRARDLVALGLDAQRYGFGRRTKAAARAGRQDAPRRRCRALRRRPGREPLGRRAAAGPDRARAHQSTQTAAPRRALGQPRPEERPGDREPCSTGWPATTRWRSSSRRTR